MWEVVGTFAVCVALWAFCVVLLNWLFSKYE